MTRLAGLACLVGLAVATPAPQQTAFRAVATAVVVPVSVREKGRPVTSLAATDFSVSDNGVAQTVAVASLANVPIDVTLLMDASSSVAGAALDRFKADVRSMGNTLQPSDRIRLLTFSGATSDVFGLKPAGSPLPLDAIGGQGTTALYDALASGLVAVAAADRPQVLFAFTDGFDSASTIDVNRLGDLSRSTTATLYIVLARAVASEEFSKGTSNSVAGAYHGHGMYAGGPDRGGLRAVAEHTGGSLYDNPEGESLPAVFQRLLDDFRTGYVLTYIPAGVSGAGWHELQVHVKNPAYVVRARAGYDAGR